MKITKSDLNLIIDNGIKIRDEIIASDIERELPKTVRLEREQKLAQLVNIAARLLHGYIIEIIF